MRGEECGTQSVAGNLALKIVVRYRVRRAVLAAAWCADKLPSPVQLSHKGGHHLLPPCSSDESLHPQFHRFTVHTERIGPIVRHTSDETCDEARHT
jgi:hypothetical protein